MVLCDGLTNCEYNVILTDGKELGKYNSTSKLCFPFKFMHFTEQN